MNNKIIGAVIAIVILGLGGLWYTMKPAGDNGESEQQEAMEVVEEVGESTPIPVATGESIDNVVTVDITGESFEFSQTEIRVKKGDTVKINFQSTGGFHDFVIDEFDTATKKVNPGEVTSVEFVADKTGTFEYYCSVMDHRAKGMVGKLIVE